MTGRVCLPNWQRVAFCKDMYEVTNDDACQLILTKRTQLCNIDMQ